MARPTVTDHTDSEFAPERVLAIVEDFVHSWVYWREACDDVRSAYEHWGNCDQPERGLAFANYRAALDREDQAALVHSIWTDRLRAAEAGT